MSVRVVDSQRRTRARKHSNLPESRDGGCDVDQLQSQPETTSCTTGIRIELEHRLVHTGRVMPRARAVLLGPHREAEGFVEPARALQVSTAQHHQSESGDVRHECLPNDHAFSGGAQAPAAATRSWAASVRPSVSRADRHDGRHDGIPSAAARVRRMSGDLHLNGGRLVTRRGDLQRI